MTTSHDWSGLIQTLALIWIGVRQQIIKIRNAPKEVAKEVTRETKDDMEAIKGLLNGEKLTLLREKADALFIVADLRNAPGDVEAYEGAVKEFHRLKQEQAVLLAKALQVRIDEKELEDLQKKRKF